MEGGSHVLPQGKPSQRHKTVSFPPFFVYSLAAGFQGKASPFPGAALFLSLDRKRKGKETKVTRGFSEKNASLSPPLGEMHRAATKHSISLAFAAKSSKERRREPLYLSPPLLATPPPKLARPEKEEEEKEEGAFISRD